MSDTTQAPQSSPSGDTQPAAAPAADLAAPAFGTSRGSGLSRGKRVTPAAPAASQPTDNALAYKPTAVAFVELPRENNGFGSTEAPTATVPPAPSATIEQPQPTTPAPAQEPAQQPSPVGANSTVVEKPAPAQNVPTFRAPREQRGSEKPALTILPPEPRRQTDQRWERQSERPQQPQRSSDSAHGQRQERGERRFENQRQQQSPATARDTNPPAAKTQVAEKSGGFFGWLKSLFTSSEKPTATQQSEERSTQFRSDRGGRRRGRGGRSNDGPRQNNGNVNPAHRSENEGEFRSENGGQRRGRRRGRGGRGGRGGNFHGGDDNQQGWRNSGDNA